MLVRQELDKETHASSLPRKYSGRRLFNLKCCTRMRDRRTLLRYGCQIGLTGLAAACGPIESARSLFEEDNREHISVLADASLGPAVPALKDDFERANPHVALTFSLSSSGSIMKSYFAASVSMLYCSLVTLSVYPLSKRGTSRSAACGHLHPTGSLLPLRRAAI